jgi:hypothetical protein
MDEKISVSIPDLGIHHSICFRYRSIIHSLMCACAYARPYITYIIRSGRLEVETFKVLNSKQVNRAEKLEF